VAGAGGAIVDGVVVGYFPPGELDAVGERIDNVDGERAIGDDVVDDE